MTAPIKTCNYCRAVGVMPTFMNGETVCYDCLQTLPKTLLEAWREIASLRVKVAEMERQEPVMWANSSNINSSRINRERGGCGDQHTCSETQTTYHDTQLYALPGAKGEEK